MILTTLCPRCNDEPIEPGKRLCSLCDTTEKTNVQMALDAKEMAQATGEKYPAVKAFTGMGEGMP